MSAALISGREAEGVQHPGSRPKQPERGGRGLLLEFPVPPPSSDTNPGHARPAVF